MLHQSSTYIYLQANAGRHWRRLLSDVFLPEGYPFTVSSGLSHAILDINRILTQSLGMQTISSMSPTTTRWHYNETPTRQIPDMERSASILQLACGSIRVKGGLARCAKILALSNASLIRRCCRARRGKRFSVRHGCYILDNPPGCVQQVNQYVPNLTAFFK